jgi:futalosine hydrolase
MQVLVIAATKEEIKPLLTSLIKIDTLITGVGAPNTMYYLQKKLQQKKYDIVVQAGIAGAFTNEFVLGSVVVVKQDCFADIGIEAYGGFTPIFETTMANKNVFPYQNGWLQNPILSGKTDINLPMVSAITINKVSDSKKQKTTFLKYFDAEVETMEGAALHFVCLLENIPFIQIRSFSNYVGERDKALWELELAIEQLNKELKKILKKMTD